MSIPEIIALKRDGGTLTQRHIQTFIDGVVDGTAQDAQIGAWLMACRLNGLNSQEATDLTRSMMNSGELMSWPDEWRSLLVDKHSTGGVGDKVSLVLAPALAACGMKVPMISGRGLGHTGGTLDKLESIPGYSASMTSQHMQDTLTTVGCCIAGQTQQLVPADKKLYAIRDVTSTVDNIGLITGSIICKKAAESIGVLTLDVKFGEGAFMSELSKAEELARLMVEVGCGLGIRTSALLTSMDSPLGRAVGNALEVAEAVHTLQGHGPPDFVDLVVKTGGVTLHASGKVASQEEGRAAIEEVIADGSALAKFRDMVVAHGASVDVASRLCDASGDVWNVLPRAAHQTTLKCQGAGVVQKIRAMPCAIAVQKLGGGRERASDDIDYNVGLYLHVSVGDTVSKGDPWVTVHHAQPTIPAEVTQLLETVMIVAGVVPRSTQPAVPASRVYDIIEPPANMFP